MAQKLYLELFIIQNNETTGTGLIMLTPKQTLQKLPIALAEVKAGNNSENLFSEIQQIVYSLYQSKEITRKVSITYLNQWNEIAFSRAVVNKIAFKYNQWIIYLWTQGNSETSKLDVLILKFTDKLDLRRAEKRIALSNLSFYNTSKNIKSS